MVARGCAFLQNRASALLLFLALTVLPSSSASRLAADHGDALLQPSEAAASASSAQRPSDAMDQFKSLLTRMNTNVGSEQRVHDVELMEANRACEDSLRRLNASRDALEITLAATNKTLTVNLKRFNKAQKSLKLALPRLEKKKQMLAEVNKTLQAGEAEAQVHDRISENKTKDAQVALNAVKALFTMLSAINRGAMIGSVNAEAKGAVHRFREQIQRTKAQVSDASVLRFMESTLQSLASATATSALRGPDESQLMPTKQDVENLRLLLSLLRSQLKQFVDTIKADGQAEDAVWQASRSALMSQITLLKDDITARQKEIDKLKQTSRVTGYTVKSLNATLQGVSGQELPLIKEQIATTKASCDAQRREADQQRVARKASLKFVKSLSQITFSRADSPILERMVKGLQLPALNKVDETGKRCCKLCDHLQGLKPCGDKCIKEEETCESSAEGCACRTPAATDQRP